ncbi:hypothetical protein D9757_010382 [Collybiopsis confluens]|uniref:Uncharacterized protein n=1 Tax=Collybiopsis confluens TaxID=2823264 RepID=A0A8H5GV95_9AGAR|nr:hypothetical protein D9757_010382 [Collybiopsis confluens]
MTLPPGEYFIINQASGKFVYADSTDKSGEKIYLRKEDAFDSTDVFAVKNIEGELYTISSKESELKLRIGVPTAAREGSTLVWSDKEPQFRIIPSGPGVFNIRLAAAGQFLFDHGTEESPGITPLLITADNSKDSSSWKFVVA